jgi:hypothetical protein
MKRHGSTAPIREQSARLVVIGTALASRHDTANKEVVQERPRHAAWAQASALDEGGDNLPTPTPAVCLDELRMCGLLR